MPKNDSGSYREVAHRILLANRHDRARRTRNGKDSKPACSEKKGIEWIVAQLTLNWVMLPSPERWRAVLRLLCGHESSDTHVTSKSLYRKGRQAFRIRRGPVFLHAHRKRLGMGLRAQRQAREAALQQRHQPRVPVPDHEQNQKRTVM